MKVPKPWVGAAILGLIGSGSVAAPSRSAKVVPQFLNHRTFDHWRDFIHPSAAESAWERSGWQTSLWAGVMAAQERKMPFLFWSMTGHPCGMT
jgi:hypothetical protein